MRERGNAIRRLGAKSDEKAVRIARHGFDETEFSEASGWIEEHQYLDLEGPHGFTERSVALPDSEPRLGIERQ